MYKIEKTNFGIKLMFGGYILKGEMSHWVEESGHVLKNMTSGFGVFVDMRELKPLPADSQAEMQTGQKLFKAKGMTRSVVILDNPITTMQFRRIAKETGISEWERYIDASKNTNWEEMGILWLESGIDPGI